MADLGASPSDGGVNTTSSEQQEAKAAVWDLQVGSKAQSQSALISDRPAEPESQIASASDEPIEDKEQEIQASGSDGERKRVSEADWSPGGYYRGIVKLFIRYKNQPAGQKSHGTGWLIRNDTIVTAAHWGYDSSPKKYGPAEEVTAYIGYYGASKRHMPVVECRSVKRIAVPAGWTSGTGTPSDNVGFMQVDQPFKNMAPMQFAETPESGNLRLAIVGYPLDLRENGEAGAGMYESYVKSKFNLKEQENRVLQYEISQYEPVNTGSPVLVADKGRRVAIGVHVSSTDPGRNMASAIGQFGNSYSDYLQLIQSTAKLSKDGVNIVSISKGPPTATLESVMSSGRWTANSKQ